MVSSGEMTFRSAVLFRLSRGNTWEFCEAFRIDARRPSIRSHQDIRTFYRSFVLGSRRNICRSGCSLRRRGSFLELGKGFSCCSLPAVVVSHQPIFGPAVSFLPFGRCTGQLRLRVSTALSHHHIQCHWDMKGLELWHYYWKWCTGRTDCSIWDDV